MHRSMVGSKRYEGAKPLHHPLSHYFKSNVWVTTSGMQWAPAILFCQQVLGAERVMYAMDYPYQFVPEEVKVTDELPIAEDDRRRLYHLNAERVFRL
jgi:2,3-dihydroxybenzoate decarboxylase